MNFKQLHESLEEALNTLQVAVEGPYIEMLSTLDGMTELFSRLRVPRIYNSELNSESDIVSD
jgi:hypothetical protein